MVHVPEPPASEITPPELYVSRRDFLRTGAAGAVGASIALSGLPALADEGPSGPALPVSKQVELAGGEKLEQPWEDITTYNNFYEFGTDKADPARTPGTLEPRPWTVAVDGRVPQAADGRHRRSCSQWFPLEERVYRMRCVEAWSMVIPWLGFPLGDADQARSSRPRRRSTSRSRRCSTREQMPGQRRDVLDWPYVEGLRIDEAMHPLTLLAVGLYGQALPNQNGAPLRLVVPWKYGFKGIKSIVKISFAEAQPPTTWNQYGARASTASTPT